MRKLKFVIPALLIVLTGVFFFVKQSQNQSASTGDLEHLSDTTVFSNYLSRSKEFQRTNLDSALFYGKKALSVLENNPNSLSSHVIAGLSNLGACFAMKGMLDSATCYLDKSLQKCRQSGDKISENKVLNNLGNVALFESKLDSALTYYLESLKISEPLNLWSDYANTTNNIGNIYYRLERYEKALHYYSKSVEANKKLKLSVNNSDVFASMGLIQGQLGNDSMNLYYQLEALKLFKAVDDKFGIARVYNNIALIHERKKQYKKALDYHFKAFDLRKESGEVRSNVITLHNIGLIYSLRNEHKKAIEYYQKSLHSAREIRDNELVKELYQNLARSYAESGDYKNSYTYMRSYSAVKDSIYSERSSQQISEMEAKYETEKKEHEIHLLKSEKKEKELLVQKRNLQIIAVISLLLVLLLLGFFFFNKFKTRQKHLKAIAVLETKHQERTRIARDMHDDIGASLTRISMMSEQSNLQARHNPELSESLLENLKNLSGESREAVKSLGEIIWTMNPNNDTLAGMFAYIRNFAFDYLENAGIACSIDFPENIPEKPVLPELRRNTFLIVKESLNNMVKHAGAGRAEISLQLNENDFSLVIKDDGKGFDQASESGNGLHNLKMRTEMLGGRFRLESEKGVSIHVLNVPFENTTKMR